MKLVLIQLLPDHRGKATSHRKGGWMIAQQNPVLGTQAPLCTDPLSSQLVREIEVLIPNMWEPAVRSSWRVRWVALEFSCSSYFLPLSSTWSLALPFKDWRGPLDWRWSFCLFPWSWYKFWLKDWSYRSFHISISGLVCQRKHRSVITYSHWRTISPYLGILAILWLMCFSSWLYSV